MRWGWRFGAGMALLLCVSETSAQDTTKAARDLFFKGEEAENAKRYEEALEHFRKVLQLKSSAAVWFHIGHCEESLGQLQQAKASYEHAKQEAKSQAEIVKASDAAIAAVVARMPRIGNKCISKSPCTQSLDGKPFDGLMTRVDPGTHILEAKNIAGAYRKREVTVREADVMDLETVLEDSKPGAPQGAGSSAPADPGLTRAGATPEANAGKVSSVAIATPPAETGTKRSRVLPIVLSGIALGLVGAGIASYIVAGNKADEARTACQSLLVCDKSRSTVRIWDGVALGAFSGAAIAAGFSVYLFVAPGASERSAQVGGTFRW